MGETQTSHHFFIFFGVEESLHVHRCQSCQQPEGQIKQTTGECHHLDSHQPARAAATPCRPPPRRRRARPMAACTIVAQPLAAPQAVGHHTAVDSILHCSVAAGSSGDPGTHRSQDIGSSQGPDAPRSAPGEIRHQAAGRGAQPLAKREATGHDSGAVPAALVPWRRSVQSARGRAGAAHHPLDSHAPSALAAMTCNHSLPGLKAGSLPRLQNMVQYDNSPSTCPFGSAPPPTCQSGSCQGRRYGPVHRVCPSYFPW